MAWQEVTYQITGIAPLIMHNGQTADPLNRFAKEMKRISGKRKKTEADYEAMGRIEFEAGLYMGKNGPIIPAPNIDSMIVAAAKKHREGPLSKSGVFTKSHMVLKYDGPRTISELWEDERFRNVSIVRVSMARIARTRPYFADWAGDLIVNYEDTVLNQAQLDEWMLTAGNVIGLGDWRPQHGRFEAVRI